MGRDQKLNHIKINPTLALIWAAQAWSYALQRHIVYPGQIPLDTDILNSIKDSYYGNGWSAESIIGVNTQVAGLAVTPTTPASLQVNVAPGAIYSLQTVDNAAYGSLGTDANQFTKQGILAAGTTLTITPPGTVGQSINYLVQVAFAEADSTPVILPYYNASNPSVAWSGPNNTGVAQNTVRANTCVVGLKAGAPAATGSQLTPAPDVGYTGIYVVTVAQGQTTITGGNISQLASAPYFPTLPQIPTGVQNNQWSYAVAGGTANALTAALSPIPAALVAGMAIRLKISITNTGAATLNINGLGAVAILAGDGTAIIGGYLVAGQIVDLIYDGAAFRLQNFVRRSGDTMNGSLTITSGGVLLNEGIIWRCNKADASSMLQGYWKVGSSTGVIEKRNSDATTDAQFVFSSNRIEVTDASPTNTNSMQLKVSGTSAGLTFDNITGGGSNRMAMGYSGSAIAFRVDGTNVGTVTPSDKRLKLNVREIPYSIDDFSKLKFVSYEYDQSKSPIGFPKGMRFGVIANDAEKFIPEFISEWAMDNSSKETIANTTYKQADYELLIPLMGRYIQELHARLAKLEAKQ